jgi:hypothetical protein
MPFEVTPQLNENIILLRQIYGPHGAAFGIAISNQAIYLPAKKFFAKEDPYYFQKVPLSKIKSVSLIKIKPTFLYVLAILMILFGLLTTYWMMVPVLEGKDGELKGYPLAIVVGGIVLPFIVRGRRALVITMVDKIFKWKPQLAIDSATRNKNSALLEEILNACKSVGIPTTDPIH